MSFQSDLKTVAELYYNLPLKKSIDDLHNLVKNNKDFRLLTPDSVYKTNLTFKFRLLKFPATKNNPDSGFMQIGPTESEFPNGPKLKYVSMELFYGSVKESENQFSSLKTNLEASYKMKEEGTAVTFTLSNNPYPKLILVKNSQPVPQIELIFFGEKR